MKAKDLAEILLKNPEAEILETSLLGGWIKLAKEPRRIKMITESKFGQLVPSDGTMSEKEIDSLIF